MSNKKRVYIIGAGFAGKCLLSDIQAKGIYGDVIAFLDDDSAKIGSRVQNVPVLGPIDDIARIIRPQSDDMAIIAIPSLSRQRLRKIFLLLQQQNFSRIMLLPDVEQIIEGSAHLIQAREIDLEDLLLRKPVTINLQESLKYLRGRRVLITGAGGSIGSELARQLLHSGLSRLYLFGHGENSIYEIDRALRLLQKEGVGKKTNIIPILGEIRDSDYMNFIIPRIQPDAIFHTAAYKHVPISEQNPIMVLQNNLFGTANVLNAIRDMAGVRFVHISTDKAVEPTSIYGASKRLAEELTLAEGADQPKNAIIVVRFGNVLGSRGSIVPLFRQQILNGGPLTITHHDMRRYFMTISEASSLVLKAGGVGESGKLYTLNMGEAILIRELAEQMVRFYGFEPEEDIRLECIGMRFGEKIEEHLYEKYEHCTPTEFPGIQVVDKRETHIPVRDIIRKIRPVCYPDTKQPQLYRNRRILRSILREHLPLLKTQTDEPEY